MFEFVFENRIKSFEGNKKWFMPILERAYKNLIALPHFKSGCLDGSIVLTIVDDKAISKLNLEYRGIGKATDVLSFSYLGDENFPVQNILGEIVISLATARKQAMEHRKTLKEELQLLFLHGLLHIFGYDHESPAGRKEMFDLQDSIIGDKSWRKIIDP